MMSAFKIHVPLAAEVDAENPRTLSAELRLAWADMRGDFRVELPVAVRVIARGHKPGSAPAADRLRTVRAVIERCLVEAHVRRARSMTAPTMPASWEYVVTEDGPLSLLIELSAGTPIGG